MGAIADILATPEWQDKSPIEKAAARKDLFQTSLQENPQLAQALQSADSTGRQAIYDGWKQKIDTAFPDAFTATGHIYLQDEASKGELNDTTVKAPVLDLRTEGVLDSINPAKPNAKEHLAQLQDQLKSDPAALKSFRVLARQRYGDQIILPGTIDDENIVTTRQPNLLEKAEQLLPTGIRVAGPLVGEVAGGAASTPESLGLATIPGIVGGRLAGAAAAEPLAQWVEKKLGQRKDYSLGQGALNIGIGGVAPLPVAEGAGVVEHLAARAIEGAGLGGAYNAIDQAAFQKHPFSASELLSNIGVGGAVGGGLAGLGVVSPKLKAILFGKSPTEIQAALPSLIEKASTPEAKAELAQVQTALQRKINDSVGVKAPLAPARFIGVQGGMPEAGIPDFPLFNATRSENGLIANSTYSKDAFENAGYRVPDQPNIAPGTRVDIPLSEPTAADSAQVFDDAAANEERVRQSAQGAAGLATDLAGQQFDTNVSEPVPSSLPDTSLRLPEESTPAENEVRARDFLSARAEEAGQAIRDNQIPAGQSQAPTGAELSPLPPDARVSIMDMGGKRAVQIDVPGGANGRPLFSGSPEAAAEGGYNLSIPADLPVGQYQYSDIAPQNEHTESQQQSERNPVQLKGQEASGAGPIEQRIGQDQAEASQGQSGGVLTAPPEPQLSRQAQQIADTYGAIDPVLARALTAGAGGIGGGVAGFNQDDKAPVEQRIKNGLTGLVLGAAGGYALGNSFLRLANSAAPTTSSKALNKWYGRLGDIDKTESWMEKIRNAPNQLRTALGTSFAPLDKLPKQIAAANQIGLPSLHLPLSRQFELVNGASAPAKVDFEDYAHSVLDKINPSEGKDFDALIAIKRAGQRVQAGLNLAAEQARIGSIPAAQRTADEVATLARDPNLKRVASHTNSAGNVEYEDLNSVDEALRGLRQKLGTQRFNELDQLAAGPMQQSADAALQLRVRSGLMSEEQYNAIKASNDFYAPYRVMEYADDFTGYKGTRPNPVDANTKIDHAISGIDDPNFHLGSPSQVLGEKIYQTRILAEKNVKMNVLAQLADQDKGGTVIRRLGPTESAPRGMETVNYMENGVAKHLAVAPDIQEAIKGLNPVQTGIIGGFVRRLNKPFRFLATAGNVGFQEINAPFDQLRLATTSRYGIGRGAITDTLRYPTDFIHSLYTAVLNSPSSAQSVGAVTGFYTGYNASNGDKLDKVKAGAVGAVIGGLTGRGLQRGAVGASEALTNAGLTTAGEALDPTALYRKFYQSGAAGSTLQDMINRISGKGTSFTKEAVGPIHGVINSLEDFGKAVEETTKLMGFKRGLRIEGIDNLPPQVAANKLEQVVSEVRNFSGSPDFAVSGRTVRDLNSAIVFLNPRIQGMSEDFARLFGRDGAKAAAQTWTALGGAAGLGAAYLWSRNNQPENKADYAQVSDNEKQGNAMIPRYDDKGEPLYFTNQRGQKVRDYWRIPLRDTAQTLYHLTHNAMDFAYNEQPGQTMKFAAQLLEDLSPINFQGNNYKERGESMVSQLGPTGTVPYEFLTGRDPGLHRDIVPGDRMKAGSPTNQFEPNTPQAYKTVANIMPQFMADPLRSPLQLQAMTQAFTGGGLNQFAQNDPLPGRDATANALATSPLGRRFVRSTYVNNPAPQSAQDTLTAQTDKQVTAQRDASQLLDKITSLPLPQRQALASTLTPSQITDLQKEFTRRAAKAPDQEIELIHQMSASDGTRAKYLVDRLSSMPVAQRGPFAIQLINNKDLSDTVKEQMAQIYAAKHVHN